MDCELMESIATYKPLIIGMIFQILLSIIALPMVCFVIYRIAKNPLYHINSRIILIVNGLALILHLGTRIFYFGAELYRFLIILPASNSACDIIVTSERCFGVRLGFNIGMWLSICTTPTITLERYLATRKISNYHKDRSSWCFLLGFQFVLTFILLAFVYAETRFGGFSYYCLAASTSFPTNVLIAFIITLITQATSLIFYRRLMRTNQKMKNELHAHGGELTKRYQVEETLRSLKTLSQPIQLMFFVQFTYSLVSFFILRFNNFFNRPAYYFAMEIVIFVPEYSILFVVLFIKKENRISDQSIKSLKTKINMDTDVYFQNIIKSWT